jgi:hypothetical protein
VKYWVGVAAAAVVIALLAAVVYELSEVNDNLDGVQRDLEQGR